MDYNNKMMILPFTPKSLSLARGWKGLFLMDKKSSMIWTGKKVLI
jgi:hypothetical protein